MSNPRHQHFIPKSYLKNFALSENNKFFVEAKLKNDLEPKSKLISIRDICVDKNIYTIPINDIKDKYAIEKYYANEIDCVYPEIYKLLIDEKVENITEDQRRKIILTTMSLFFRTPKFLKLNEARIDKILDDASKENISIDGIVKVRTKTYQLEFHIDLLEEVKNDFHVVNKVHFLNKHIGDLHDFVEFKMNAGISVMKVVGEIDLITSDNPVEMHSTTKNRFHPFDPTNIIRLPLDSRHYLIIYPNTEEIIKEYIFRSERDSYFVLTSNYNSEKNSEDWILGKPGSIGAHVKDQKKYFSETPDNLKMMSVFEEMTKDLKDLGEKIDQYGITHEITLNKIKELIQKPIHQHNKNLKENYEELRKKGYID